MHERVATVRQLENMFKTSVPEMRRPDGDPFNTPIERYRTTKTTHSSLVPIVSRFALTKSMACCVAAAKVKLQLRAKAIHIIKMGLVLDVMHSAGPWSVPTRGDLYRKSFVCA
jgi:hypothetical protein